MDSNTKTCVVYATDGNPDDVCRMAWSMRSLVRHASVPFDLIVLSDSTIECPPGVDLGARGSYHCVTDMKETLLHEGVFSNHWSRRWPFTVIYRLGIPVHPFFRDYGRVLYVDTDTLVLSPRIDRLLTSELSGYEVRGVYDIDGDNYPRIDSLLSVDLAGFKDRRLDSFVGDVGCRAYVNAGVLLFNLDEIRKDIRWYRDRLVMFWKAECRGLFRYLDQDFVNAMMRVRADTSTMFNWQRGGYPPNCTIRHYIRGQKDDMRARAVTDGLI